jgi:hypothetical protein
MSVAIGMGIIGFGWLFPAHAEPVVDFYKETLLPSSAGFEGLDRVALHRQSVEVSIRESGALGHGTGSASQGLYYLGSFLYGDPYRLLATEGLFSAITWEHGVTGLVLWVWLMYSVAKHQIRAARAVRSTRFFGVASSIAIWTCLFLFVVAPAGMQVFQEYVSNSCLWLFSGILFRLPTLPELRQN